MWFNVGTFDRRIRLAAGLVLIWLYVGGRLAGPLGLLAAFAGFAAVLTGVTGACPLYRLIGVDTRRPNGGHGKPLHRA